MISRRRAIRSLGLGALAVPAASGLALGNSAKSGSDKMPSGDDPAFWKKVRSLYMLAPDKVFFNPGTFGAMPRVVVDKMVEHLRYTAEHVADWAYKDDSKERFIACYQNLMFIREKLGKLFNCDPREIALTDNVTHGMSYIANGLALKAGDEVLTTNQEHSGGQSSWMLKAKRFGTTFRTINVPKPVRDRQEVYDLIVGSLSDKTRVLMLSHIITGSGAILPVKEICAEATRRGITTVLDGAQAVGHIALDFRDIGCDAYVGCFHKWIGAPAGTGFMYVRADRMQEVWTTVASGLWDNHDDEGYRFIQRGTGNFSVLAGLDAALDFHSEIGGQRVYDRIKFLGTRLRDGLRANKKVRIFSPTDESMCAGITVYNIDGFTGTKLQDEYWARGRMRPRSVGDQYGVRHCTHIFNSPEEIDSALKVVGELSA